MGNFFRLKLLLKNSGVSNSLQTSHCVKYLLHMKHFLKVSEFFHIKKGKKKTNQQEQENDTMWLTQEME